MSLFGITGSWVLIRLTGGIGDGRVGPAGVTVGSEVLVSVALGADITGVTEVVDVAI